LEEQIVHSGVLNMARMWEAPARTMGGRWARWGNAWATDSTLSTRLLNRVTIVQRVRSSAAAQLVDRIERFYSERPNGGEYLVNDPWATIDLEPYGYTRWWSLPFMIRYPATAPQRRSDLEIRECRSPDQFADFVRTLVDGFGLAELDDVPTTLILDQRLLAEHGFRCWVGVLDGRTIGTSVALIANGVVGVYLVAVVPSMRGRGFGEELTWQATLADRAPATLQASAMGRPVYERMGYITALECATWIKSSRVSSR
jgi:GNAT superfamily N-acetyltransferase